MKKGIILFILCFVINNIFSQDFFRIIELKNDRIHGSDIIKLQTQLINYGFENVGEIDGYYGPLAENVIKVIQYYLGFEQNGKIDKKLWDILFDESNNVLLKNINTVSKYNLNELRKESDSRMGYSTEGGQVDKYYMENELKRINLYIGGEMGQVHYYFHYINSNYYFIVTKNYNYPYHLFDIIKDNETFWKETIITYKTYLKKDNNLFQIINGDFYETNFDLDRIIEMVEDKNLVF